MAKIYKIRIIVRVQYLAFQNHIHRAIHSNLILKIRDNHRSLLLDRETK